MLCSDHRALGVLLVAQSLLFWWVVGSGSLWVTAPLECAPGGMVGMLLGDSGWPVWDTFEGALGGMFLAGLAGLPLFAVAGVTALTIKAVAWLGTLAVLLVVYRFLDRHESRLAALLAVAGLSFCPPLLFHSAAVIGNWHWTQLIFDYGLALVALDLVRGREPAWRWTCFGILSGLAIFNCVASFPFVALSWGFLLLGSLGREKIQRFGLAVAGTLLGLLPFLYKALWHRPFGRSADSGDRTLGRLAHLDFEPARAMDLVYPELPWALHIHDVLESWPLAVTWRLASTWSVLVWVGFCIALFAALGELRQRWREGGWAAARRLPAALLPPLFVLAFVAAYVVVQVRVEILPVDFSNLRESGHRMLPPLLASLLISSGVGWARLASRWSGARSAVLVAALFPVAIGLVSQWGLVERRLAPEERGLQVYRASCTDVPGVFLSRALARQPQAALASCESLGGADARDCKQGFAWGVGKETTSLTAGSGAGAGGDPARAFAFSEASLATCEALPSDLRSECIFGMGWWAGSADWGKEHWPLEVCDSLAAPADRETCWTGVGFPVGDHLHLNPAKVVGVLGRVPPPRRSLAAQGVGRSLARAFGSRAVAEDLCERLGSLDAVPCLAGIEQQRP